MCFPNFRLNSIATIVAVLFFDQLSKFFIAQNLKLGQVIPYTSWFNLVFRQNRGISFGLFPAHTGYAKLVLISLIIALMIWVVHQLWIATNRLESMAYALILGGALGNLIDRFSRGTVVDFLEFHIDRYAWPAFNVADSCIVTGAILIFGWQTWQSWGNLKVKD